MSWLQEWFGEGSAGLSLVLIVLGLAAALVLLFWVFRRIAGDSRMKPGRNRQPRLSVTDAAIVDDKRRLVLVRRDNVEHLVMIGGPTDIVIEQNIARDTAVPVAARHSEAPAPAEQEPHVEPHVEPEIETPVEAPRQAVAPRPLPRRELYAEPRHEPRPASISAHLAHMPEPPRGRLTPLPKREAEAPTLDHAAEFEGDLARSLGDDAAPQANDYRAAEVRPPPEPRRAPPPIQPVTISSAPRAMPPKRQDNMEDEMQRLLEELSGTKLN